MQILEVDYTLMKCMHSSVTPQAVQAGQAKQAHKIIRGVMKERIKPCKKACKSKIKSAAFIPWQCASVDKDVGNSFLAIYIKYLGMITSYTEEE